MKDDRGLAIALNDLDNSVRGTRQFLFNVGRFERHPNAPAPQATCTPIIEACWRQGVQVSVCKL